MSLAIETAERAYRMLDNENLWQVTRRVHALLAGQSIPHAIVGGVAVCLHGYRRNTVDLDLLVRRDDADAIRATLRADGFAWNESSKEFASASGVAVQFVVMGDREGSGQEVRFPDPSEAVTSIEGLPVLTLPHLVQAKIACALGSPRRTHKDLADVVELIAIHQLDGSFARFLHKSVRKEYRSLVRRSPPERRHNSPAARTAAAIDRESHRRRRRNTRPARRSARPPGACSNLHR